MNLAAIFLAIAIAFASLPTSSPAEAIIEKCVPISFSGEINSTNGFHLRYQDAGKNFRKYFVYNSKSGCSLIVEEKLETERDRIWLFRMAELTTGIPVCSPFAG
ncbi:hypothetical protein [uncultured Tateyamaria sp.]|uniref:hypothetical protein n=1 Tax=uncultured Tateyamaria sp. TaxID=455651 RepID=UPI00262FC8BD|nr:hypothetical protein [uncultured Tateyamaria sp.]